MCSSRVTGTNHKHRLDNIRLKLTSYAGVQTRYPGAERRRGNKLLKTRQAGDALDAEKLLRKKYVLGENCRADHSTILRMQQQARARVVARRLIVIQYKY